MNTQRTDSTLDWAREHGVPFSFTTLLTNHEPPRHYHNGHGWYYSLESTGETGIILADILPSGIDATYLVDDGDTVRPYYVAGYGPAREEEETYVLLRPFPTNTNPDGLAKWRADNGRPVDYSSWIHGPRRAYHLKVRGDQ